MVTEKKLVNSIFCLNSNKSHPKAVFLFKVNEFSAAFEQKSKLDLRTQSECRVISNRPRISWSSFKFYGSDSRRALGVGEQREQGRGFDGFFYN